MELRSKEQIKKDFEIEKKLAIILKNSNKSERRNLYESLYNEYFSKSSHRFYVGDEENKKKRVKRQMNLIKKFLNKKDATFLEIGGGNGELSSEVSKFLNKVYFLEVSSVLKKNIPNDFEIIFFNGVDMPKEIEAETIDIVFSNQVLEHIHSDDIAENMAWAYKVLKKGGVFICITPNSLSGPHDDSRYFNLGEPQGFHLKEYTIRELHNILKNAGFFKVRSYYAGGRGIYLKFPIFLAKLIEGLITALPIKIRKKISKVFFVKAILGINIVMGK